MSAATVGVTVEWLDELAAHAPPPCCTRTRGLTRPHRVWRKDEWSEWTSCGRPSAAHIRATCAAGHVSTGWLCLRHALSVLCAARGGTTWRCDKCLTRIALAVES